MQHRFNPFFSLIIVLSQKFCFASFFSRHAYVEAQWGNGSCWPVGNRGVRGWAMQLGLLGYTRRVQFGEKRSRFRKMDIYFFTEGEIVESRVGHVSFETKRKYCVCSERTKERYHQKLLLRYFFTDTNLFGIFCFRKSFFLLRSFFLDNFLFRQQTSQINCPYKSHRCTITSFCISFSLSTESLFG